MFQAEVLIMKSAERTKSKSGAAPAKNAAERNISEQQLRERVAQKAYELYQKCGQVQGRDLEDWLEAEKLVLAELKDERDSKIKTPRRKSNGPKEDKATEER
jgi:hypothetical protein